MVVQGNKKLSSKGFLCSGDIIIGEYSIQEFSIQHPTSRMNFSHTTFQPLKAGPSYYQARITGIKYNPTEIKTIKRTSPDNICLCFTFRGKEVNMTNIQILEKEVNQSSLGGEPMVTMLVQSDEMHTDIANGIDKAKRRLWQKTLLQKKTAELG